MTNLEKIRGMSKEELAGFLYDVTYACEKKDCNKCPIKGGDCVKCDNLTIEKFLDSEVSDE